MGIGKEIKKDLERYMDLNNSNPYLFSKKAGVAPSTITRFLNDKFNPSVKLLEIIAKEIGGKIDYRKFEP